MEILVVEDDNDIASQIERGLALSGHQATLAGSVNSAMKLMAASRFDAVVLDRMLPDGDGIQVLQALQCRANHPPVIVLSALGSVHDRITGLNAGADDYLAKPFSVEELEARIAAVTRRLAGPDAESSFSVGMLVLDPEGHNACFGGCKIELNRKQFSLLAHLMRNADRLVTRRMLLEHVWGYSFEPATNIVESNMSRLRARLQAVGCDAIETRRGAGYLLQSAGCT